MKERKQIPHKKIYQLALKPTVRFSIAGKAKQAPYPLCLNARITGRGGILKTGLEKAEAYF